MVYIFPIILHTIFLGDRLGVGRHVVAYDAFDMAGNRASCFYDIYVQCRKMLTNFTHYNILYHLLCLCFQLVIAPILVLTQAMLLSVRQKEQIVLVTLLVTLQTKTLLFPNHSC